MPRYRKPRVTGSRCARKLLILPLAGSGRRLHSSPHASTGIVNLGPFFYSMSLTQKLFRAFVSKEKMVAIEKESREWMLQCPCGAETSYWDTGGIRYKASSAGKKIFMRCPTCHTRAWMNVHRKKIS